MIAGMSVNSETQVHPNTISEFSPCLKQNTTLQREKDQLVNVV
jgi:hypothetical protein